MKLKMTITDDELIDKINKLITQVPNTAVDLMADACKVVEAKSKENCPVDTGNLANSITHTVNRDLNGAEGYVYSEVEYAPYVHDGTYKMNGNPFLEKALNSENKKVIKIFKKIFEDSL